jgi:hypothetical protein
MESPLKSSWPGLTRPSTSISFLLAEKDVDPRVKPAGGEVLVMLGPDRIPL